MNDQSPPFTYSTLSPGEIRLLIPGDHNDVPAWVLETVGLDTPYLEFDALSYTWDSQTATYPILCNGRSMHIHQNLHSALPFLARRMGELTHRPIWVDAVCINQKDEDEKRAQIQLMNLLYRRAKQVWIWLGLAPHTVQAYVQEAITLLPHTVEEAKRRKASAYTWGKEEVALPLRNLEPDLWKAMLHLIGNSWYARVWIVQEAALASEITFLCGAHKIDGALLKSAVESDTFGSWKVSDINGNRVELSQPSVDNSTVFWIRDLVQAGKETLSLDTPNLLLRMAILMTGNHYCFLPQDRVFGMLGLVENKELSTTGVEFDAYAPIPILYTQFTAYLLLNTDPNETQFWWPVFNLAFTLNKCDELPSWVADFHHQDGGSEDVCTTRTIAGFGRTSKQYCASGKRTRTRLFPGMGKILLQGKILDKIIVVHPAGIRPFQKLGWQGSEAEWLASIAEWQEHIAQAVLCHDNHKDNGLADHAMEKWRVSDDIYWRTLFANNFLDESNKPITIDTCRLFNRTMLQVRQWCEWSIESIRREAVGVEELPDEIKAKCSLQAKMSAPYQSIVIKLVKLGDRQLFNTTHGRIGFTIKGVQPGDIVCVFNSASTPHILRKFTNRDDEAYRVIGDAYIDGLMLAEADGLDVDEQDILLV